MIRTLLVSNLWTVMYDHIISDLIVEFKEEPDPGVHLYRMKYTG